MDVGGSVAFITGAASGAGLVQAPVFGAAGCRLFLVDVREGVLATAVDEQHFEVVPDESTDPEGVARRTAALRNRAPERDGIVSRAART